MFTHDKYGRICRMNNSGPAHAAETTPPISVAHGQCQMAGVSGIGVIGCAPTNTVAAITCPTPAPASSEASVPSFIAWPVFVLANLVAVFALSFDAYAGATLHEGKLASAFKYGGFNSGGKPVSDEGDTSYLKCAPREIGTGTVGHPFDPKKWATAPSQVANRAGGLPYHSMKDVSRQVSMKTTVRGGHPHDGRVVTFFGQQVRYEANQYSSQDLKQQYLYPKGENPECPSGPDVDPIKKSRLAAGTDGDFGFKKSRNSRHKAAMSSGSEAGEAGAALGRQGSGDAGNRNADKAIKELFPEPTPSPSPTPTPTPK